MQSIEEKYMKIALLEAQKSLKWGDVPIGCVIVSEEGKIIARAHNQREKTGIPTAHAEILAINKAGKKLKRWNLTGCTLYVTLEPCVMCAGAMVNARISKVVFGAYDKRFGCCGTIYNLASDEKFNHRCEVVGGIMEEQCVSPIKEFFRQIRLSKNTQNGQISCALFFFLPSF